MITTQTEEIENLFLLAQSKPKIKRKVTFSDEQPGKEESESVADSQAKIKLRMEMRVKKLIEKEKA